MFSPCQRGEHKTMGTRLPLLVVWFLCSENQSPKYLSALGAYTSFAIQKLIRCFAVRTTASAHAVTQVGPAVSVFFSSEDRIEVRSVWKMRRCDPNLASLPTRWDLRLPGLSCNQLLQSATSFIQFQVLQRFLAASENILDPPPQPQPQALVILTCETQFRGNP